MTQKVVIHISADTDHELTRYILDHSGQNIPFSYRKVDGEPVLEGTLSGLALTFETDTDLLDEPSETASE